MERIERLKEIIKNASHILITAGAGMSADSGLPTYRDKEGLWKAYPPLKNLNLGFYDITTPSIFHENPKLAWAFYGYCHNLYSQTTPHRGYKMLLDLCKSKKSYFVMTSNIDGHFIKAGFDSQKVFEIHGSLEYLQCICRDNVWKMREKIPMNGLELIELPKCPFCGGTPRPNVMMFYDLEFNHQRTEIQASRFWEWRDAIEEESLVIIEIGAGLAVPTIRREGEKIAKSHRNSRLIRINPLDDKISPIYGYSLALNGLEAIKKLSDS